METKENPDSYARLLGDLEATVNTVGEGLEGHTEGNGELGKQTETYNDLARDTTFDTICETGFNAGHSALRFLAQSNAALYEFDLGSHKYSKVAAGFLSKRFGSRLNNIWGDSTKSLPKFHAEHSDVKCKVVIVDGGHAFNVALADLINFEQMAASDHVLTIDDTPCDASYCEGPNKAWKQLVDEGCVQETLANHMGLGRGFSVGRYVACKRWPSRKGVVVETGANSGLVQRITVGAKVAKPRAAGMFKVESELQSASGFTL